jgi:glyoxylase-like metal-dependent hydrolase (beta-lactamase superfamily II)
MTRYSQLDSTFPVYASIWKTDTAMAELMDFDYHLIGEPDIYLVDGQELKLGRSEVMIVKTPGHSRGSASFSVGNYLFSGDLLFRGSVGDINYIFESKDDIVKSIRRLYTLFPDGTIVYPGHGVSTDIGTEKRYNKCVTMDDVTW